MPADPFYYCSPCRIKVLVVPVGKLRENEIIRFKDVGDNERLGRAMFNPSNFPRGQLLLEYLTEWQPYYSYLEDFQHWRKLYGIIGIVDEYHEQGNTTQEQEFEALKAKYKFTLVQKVLAPKLDNSPHEDTVPSFLLDFSVRLLMAVSDMAQAIQALPTVRSPTDPSQSNDPTPPELKRPASVGPGVLQRTPSVTSIKPSTRNSLIPSQNASSESLPEKRGTSKGRGRVLKVLGDLSLICGILPDALASYTQSVEILRLTTDYVWHASALEGVGMVLVLLAYLKVEFVVPTIVQPTITVSNYEPSKSTHPPTNDFSTDPFPTQSLLDVLPETHTHILNLYHRSLSSSTLEPVPPICISENIVRLASLMCNAYVSGSLDERALQAGVFGTPLAKVSATHNMYPPRGEIARWAMRACGDHLEHSSIPMSHRIQIIAALVRIMGTIGFHRRRAILLNQLLHLLAPQLVQARVVGAAERGFHPNAALGIVQPVSDDQGLLSLMESLTTAYGAIIPLDDQPMFGWAALRADVVRDCIAVCEALPHPGGIVHFTSLLFTVAGDELEKEEQIRLAGNLPRAVTTGKKRNMTIETEYWDENVVQTIEIQRLAEIEPRKRPTSILEDRSTSNHGPFLYKARAEELELSMDKQPTQLFQNEEVNVNIVLRNKFAFDLEVTSLTTTGVTIEMPSSSFILPAQSLHSHCATFVPREPGQLRIEGCVIRFSACKTRHFPILGERTRREREAWYDMRGGEFKTKTRGISSSKLKSTPGAEASANTYDDDQFWPRKTVDVTILPPQPVLVVERSSLQDGCIMLLEGERNLINLRLRNISHSVVNQLAVTFYDSTSPVLEEALASNILAEDDASELEHFLYERPAFVWDLRSSPAILIRPDETADIDINVHGKRGLTHGSILIEYTHIAGTAETFSLPARRLEMSLAVTVNASLELVTCDFIPYSSGPEISSTSCLPGRPRSGMFLLVLELRNSWISPLDLQLVVKDADAPLVHHSLHSGQTRRIVVPLPRIVLSSACVESPLPRRRKDRQFVVPTASSRTSIALAREAWWYRQHILDHLEGTWMEQGTGGHTGNIELRGIRLNERHVRVVRCQAMEANIEPMALDDKNLCHKLLVNVKNNQGNLVSRITDLIRNTDESKAICGDGIIQSPVIYVPTHETISWETEVTLLAQGNFEIGVIIQEVLKGDDSRLGRRWSSEPCYVRSSIH